MLSLMGEISHSINQIKRIYIIIMPLSIKLNITFNIKFVKLKTFANDIFFSLSLFIIKISEVRILHQDQIFGTKS